MHCHYFICERKFYARTHVKITRHWKSTLLLSPLRIRKKNAKENQRKNATHPLTHIFYKKDRRGLRQPETTPYPYCPFMSLTGTGHDLRLPQHPLFRRKYAFKGASHFLLVFFCIHFPHSPIFFSSLLLRS